MQTHTHGMADSKSRLWVIRSLEHAAKKCQAGAECRQAGSTGNCGLLLHSSRWQEDRVACMCRPANAASYKSMAELLQARLGKSPVNAEERGSSPAR